MVDFRFNLTVGHSLLESASAVHDDPRMTIGVVAITMSAIARLFFKLHLVVRSIQSIKLQENVAHDFDFITG